MNGEHIRDIPTKMVVSLFFELHLDTTMTREAYNTLCSMWPKKLVDKKLYKLVDDGILDYGCSIATCWVRKKGIKYVDSNICLLFMTGFLKNHEVYIRYLKHMEKMKSKHIL